MKWLIITDNLSVQEKIENTITDIEKKSKYVTCNFEEENLKKQKKVLKDIAAAIVYSDESKKSDFSKCTTLSSMAGFLAAKGIQVITNIDFIYNSPWFEKNGVFAADSADSLCAIISKKYTSITEQAVKRISKNKLLDRGIPFTSDCFATYIAKNKIEVVNEFLEAGMSVNSRDDMGVPMLNIACRNDNFEFVEMLLGLGAELNASSEDRGYTAVMDAVWRGNEKITKMLIEKGAELNTINKEGQTNLILAVGANRLNICKILVENGADPDVKDQMGMSAYTYAVLFKKDAIKDILSPYHKQN